MIYRRACLFNCTIAVRTSTLKQSGLFIGAPLRLELCIGLPLGVVSDRLDIDEAANIKLLSPEHRHLDGIGDSWSLVSWTSLNLQKFWSRYSICALVSARRKSVGNGPIRLFHTCKKLTPGR